jgi:hypothetical protein
MVNRYVSGEEEEMKLEWRLWVRDDVAPTAAAASVTFKERGVGDTCCNIGDDP